jgi:NAD(P)H-flavin reductase
VPNKLCICQLQDSFGDEELWRELAFDRPIGFASTPTRTGSFDIVVRTVGRVSTAINSRGAGDSLLVRGPLGNGFDVEALKGHDVLIVAGGIGLCPTRSLIQYIATGASPAPRTTSMWSSGVKHGR